MNAYKHFNELQKKLNIQNMTKLDIEKFECLVYKL